MRSLTPSVSLGRVGIEAVMGHGVGSERVYRTVYLGFQHARQRV